MLDSYANLTHFTYTVLTHFLWGSFRSCNLSIHLLNLKRSRHRCGINHKASNADHVMLPEKQDDKQERKTTKPRCHKHPDVVMALFCKDCEVGICHVCAKTQHSQCLSVTTQIKLAQEEKERLRECSNQNSEVSLSCWLLFSLSVNFFF